MKNNFKYVKILIALSLVISLCGCGKKSEADRKDELEKYFLGKHIRSSDESSIIISEAGDGSFNIEIGIFRLCLLDNGVGTFEDHVMNFTVEDPSGNEMQGRIYRDLDNSLTVEITNSTWLYLHNGDTLTGFGI